MDDLLKTTLIGLFFGTFGTTIGGIITSIGLAIHNFPEGILQSRQYER